MGTPSDLKSESGGVFIFLSFYKKDIYKERKIIRINIDIMNK